MEDKQQRDTKEFQIKCRLIDEVQDNPFIYDKAHVDHFCTDLKNKTFHEIGLLLGIDGE